MTEIQKQALTAHYGDDLKFRLDYPGEIYIVIDAMVTKYMEISHIKIESLNETEMAELTTHIIKYLRNISVEHRHYNKENYYRNLRYVRRKLHTIKREQGQYSTVLDSIITELAKELPEFQVAEEQ